MSRFRVIERERKELRAVVSKVAVAIMLAGQLAEAEGAVFVVEVEEAGLIYSTEDGDVSGNGT